MYTYVFWFGCFNFRKFKSLCQFYSLQKESTQVKIWKLIMPGKKTSSFLFTNWVLLSVLKLKINIMIYTKIVSSGYVCWRNFKVMRKTCKYNTLHSWSCGLDRKMVNVHRLKCHIRQDSIWLNWSNLVTYYFLYILSWVSFHQDILVSGISKMRIIAPE